jgi:hypothetical protein
VRQHTNRPVSELRCSGFLCKSRLGESRLTGGRARCQAGGRAGGHEPASNLERREAMSVGVALTGACVCVRACRRREWAGGIQQEDSVHELPWARPCHVPRVLPR